MWLEERRGSLHTSREGIVHFGSDGAPSAIVACLRKALECVHEAEAARLFAEQRKEQEVLKLLLSTKNNTPG
jgi:hypothetical protein